MERKFQRQDVKRLSQSHNIHGVVVDREMDPKEVMNPDHWTFVAEFMRVGDEVRAVPEDYKWVQRLVVVDKPTNSIVHFAQESLTKLEKVKFERDDSTDERYVVKYIQAQRRGWCLIDTQEKDPDKKYLLEKAESKEAAESYLAELLLENAGA